MANLNDPQHQPLWAFALKVFPGFVGAVVAAAWLAKAATKLQAMIAIISGTFTSVFIAPYLASVVAPENPHAYTGLGYAVGILTVAVVPTVVRRFNELVQEVSWENIIKWLRK